jgi:hypothetical protein|nr:MAG TPA_asm: hypothetical protein [Caudoviricetes sp.]
MSVNLISRIFSDYHKGKDGTNGRKYRYTLEYNPLSAVHTWIIRQPLNGGAWEWVQPLPLNLCFTPRGAVR